MTDKQMSRAGEIINTAYLLAVTEIDFQEAVIDTAHAYGWIVAHFRPARTSEGWRTPVSADGAGFPDLVLVKDGQPIVFAELKSEKGKITEQQQTWINLIAVCDGNVYIWRPSDWDEIQAVLSR